MNTLVPLDEVFNEFDLSSPFTHVLGSSFTHCMNKVNLIILKLSKRKMLPTSTQDNAKTQTNKLKNFFCTTMIALFIQSNTVYYVWKS